jgi:hypothetical protein
VRVIERLPVAWSPYAVTFSHDGTRLAIGGGTWYGLGGITLIDLRTRERADHPIGALDPSLLETAASLRRAATAPQRSVSGLAFTSDDRHLLASTWTSGVRRGAAIAFEIDHLELRQVAAYVSREPLTGIHAHRSGAVIRIWRTEAHETLGTLQWGAELQLAGAGRPELTSHRIALARGNAFTGDHGAQAGSARLDPSVIARPLDRAKVAVHRADHDSTVSAIGTQGDALIVGHASGRLAAWSWQDSRPVLDHVLGDIPTVENDAALWAIYQRTSVVGLCSLADGRGAAITAGGMLATWAPGKPIDTWPLPVLGTPRAIAASPDRALLAVGVKSNRGPTSDSSVAIIELDPDELAESWRTPRATQVAAAFDPQRPLDPITLGVLADALEEAGAPPRVLHHLRTHDHRLRTCWVLDQLRVLPSP